MGERLRAHRVPVIEFRASIIFGSGSLSFDMIRTLVGRLPVMVTPRWVRVTAQAITISDVRSTRIVGLAHWYGVWPLHQLVFAGMLNGIVKAAEERP